MKPFASLAFASVAVSAFAGTTKGLNQIVTPDVQAKGDFSVSIQAQHEAIGNGVQAQYEYGLVKNIELAYFEGWKPGEGYLAAELGIIAKGDWLLSTGFLNWTTAGDRPQPFLEGGWYHGKHKAIFGGERVADRTLAIWGYAYQATPKLLLQADYLTGNDNFSTYGFTYSVNDKLTINPALYVANSSDHRLYPYVVVTYTVHLK